MEKCSKKFEEKFNKAREMIGAAKKIVIISHRGPDGDTVGANMALRLALKNWDGAGTEGGAQKEVISACVDAPPPYAAWLPEANEFQPDFDLEWADLIIAVDCGSASMTKFGELKPELFKDAASRPLLRYAQTNDEATASARAPAVVNFDHHATNDNFGTLNIVAPESAAACEILYCFLTFCGIKITRQIATCLLSGLYFDTGSFMHSNTSPEVLRIASDLLWKGADFKRIARMQFHTMPVPQLRLYGKIFERAHVNSKRLTVSALAPSDFAESETKAGDATGAIDYLNSIPDGDFCCLIYEDPIKGVLKGSFRSRVDSIDLSALAGIFGGGGHKKAAGFSLPGHLLETSEKITIS